LEGKTLKMADRNVDERSWAQRFRDEKGVVVEAIRHLAWLPRYSRLPDGDGHPVLVLPAYSVSDRATWPLRRIINGLGYSSHGWALGPNRGADPAMLVALDGRFQALHAAHGQPVSVVGWSLGGVFARRLARHHPAAVRQVITLGSPYRRSEADRGYEAPPVPTTSVFSKTDAVVDWRNATEDESPMRRNVEVRSTHSGLALNPDVIEVVVNVLAEPSHSLKR
jgi:pimeloyl-ACP methyl ester carboxylesterase